MRSFRSSYGLRWLCLAVLLFAAPVAAQETPSVSFSGAYSFVRTSLADTAGDNEAALATSLAVRFGQNWAGRFDAIQLLSDPLADGISPANARIFAGGPEFRVLASKLGIPSSQSWNSEKVELFAHALIGGVRANGDSDFAFVIGGGADYPLGNGFAVRVAQIQFLRAPIDAGGFTLRNNIGISSGINWSF